MRLPIGASVRPISWRCLARVRIPNDFENKFRKQLLRELCCSATPMANCCRCFADDVLIVGTAAISGLP